MNLVNPQYKQHMMLPARLVCHNYDYYPYFCLLPIGFIEGFLGKLFIEFAWTLAFCVLFCRFCGSYPNSDDDEQNDCRSEAPKPKILQNFDIYLNKAQNFI